METHSQTQTAPTPTNGTNGRHAAAPRRFVRPRASITETADGFTVEVEMPGVPSDGLEITFENGELTLVGRRANLSADGQETLYRESHAADYRRVFEVDNTVDAGRIHAALDQGVLTLSLPKAEAAKPRRIAIGGLN